MANIHFLQGRMNRKVYLLRLLMTISLALSLQVAALHFETAYESILSYFQVCLTIAIIAVIYVLCISISRQHDMDEPTWKVVFLLIPIVNIFWFIHICTTDGTIGRNRFGKDPKHRYSFYD